MTENTTTPDATTPEVEASAVEETKSYEKGTWQFDMQRSASLLDRSTKARKQASTLLWNGATEAINEWLPESNVDVSGENLYTEVLDILGKARKGDASKIKTVAVAVKDHGLVLSVHPNLSKAYAEAVRLTKTQRVQAEEDDAAEKAIESIEAPSTTTTVDGAARLLLSKGIDGAIVAILDALGAKNEAAHKAFMRAVGTEVSARIAANKPKPAPKAPATDKAGAKVAGAAKPAPKATVKSGAAKTKAAPVKPGTKAKPVPVSASKGDPNKRALPAKPAQATVEASADKGEAVTAPVAAGDETPTETATVVKKKAAPVVVKR